MVSGQGLHAHYRVHDQLRHFAGVSPSGMVDLAYWLRQLRVRHWGPKELALKDDQNRIPITSPMFPLVRLINQPPKFLLVPASLEFKFNIGGTARASRIHEILSLHPG
jgi:hypothetical protein